MVEKRRKLLTDKEAAKEFEEAVSVHKKILSFQARFQKKVGPSKKG